MRLATSIKKSNKRFLNINLLSRASAFLIILSALFALSACHRPTNTNDRPATYNPKGSQPEPYTNDEREDYKVKTETAFRQVFINGTRLSDTTISDLEQRFGERMRDGRYWYDSMCGAWGVEGGPAIGITNAGLNLGGQLRADASSGDTGVFINGRELHYLDLIALQQLVGGYVQPASYWVDAYGNCGFEGGPVLGNLVQAAYNRGGGSGGSGRSSALTTWDRTGVAVYDLSQ
jgi:hypothetical protein